MAHYCDTDDLELRWLQWVLSDSVRALELDENRNTGTLFTKLIEPVIIDGKIILDKAGNPKYDPNQPVKVHFISSTEKYLVSVKGEVFDLQPDCEFLPNGMYSKIMVEEKSIANGYYKEIRRKDAWDSFIVQIYKMCTGIATKFHRQNLDDRNDLSHEALNQVISKLVRGRLKYIPGKAPVFSLLTTTIHRVMFSIMSKNTKIKSQINNLLNDLSCCSDHSKIQNRFRNLRLLSK